MRIGDRAVAHQIDHREQHELVAAFRCEGQHAAVGRRLRTGVRVRQLVGATNRRVVPLQGAINPARDQRQPLREQHRRRAEVHRQQDFDRCANAAAVGNRLIGHPRRASHANDDIDAITRVECGRLGHRRPVELAADAAVRPRDAGDTIRVVIRNTGRHDRVNAHEDRLVVPPGDRAARLDLVRGIDKHREHRILRIQWLVVIHLMGRGASAAESASNGHRTGGHGEAVRSPGVAVATRGDIELRLGDR